MQDAKEIWSELVKACELLDKASACSGIGPDAALTWWSEKGRLTRNHLSLHHQAYGLASADLSTKDNEMFEHIDSLNFLLSNERIRLSLAKSESEIAIRSGWVKQLEKEIEGEKKFIAENAISDDDLLSELGY